MKRSKQRYNKRYKQRYNKNEQSFLLMFVPTSVSMELCLYAAQVGLCLPYAMSWLHQRVAGSSLDIPAVCSSNSASNLKQAFPEHHFLNHCVTHGCSVTLQAGIAIDLSWSRRHTSLAHRKFGDENCLNVFWGERGICKSWHVPHV